MIGPIQEFLAHLYPIHDVTIFLGVDDKSLLRKEQSITVDEIAYRCTIGKSISIRYLHHLITVIQGDPGRCAAGFDQESISVGYAGEDLEIRSECTVTKDLPTICSGLYYDRTIGRLLDIFGICINQSVQL